MRGNKLSAHRDRMFMMSTQKEGGEKGLEICHVFADSIVFNKRSIFHFFG